VLAGGVVTALAALAGCSNDAMLRATTTTTPTAALLGHTGGSSGSEVPLSDAGSSPDAPTPVAAAPPPTPTNTPEPDPPTPEPEPTLPPVLNGDPWWHKAVQTPDGAWMGVVTAVGLNVRDAPSPDANVLEETYARHLLTVYETDWDESSQSLWYDIGHGRYVAADFVEPFIAPDASRIFDDHWVDVNLSEFYAVAYDGSLPVYAAIITAGRNDLTPLGDFTILYRVRIGDMDAATLGVKKKDPDYYLQPDVEYAQYFKAGGFAIHGNYWTLASQFGGFSSHGCVGLLNPDAAWFWDYLGTGSAVSIHE
jgi:hypothetical protein